MVEHAIDFLLTSSPATTESLSSETAAKLRASDTVERYSECGWRCATGFLKGRVHVMVHANSDAEIDRALGIEREGSHSHYGHWR